MEGPSLPSQNSSSQASIPASITATVNSTQALPFIQVTGPQQTSAQAPNHINPQHYVALSPTFQHTDSTIQTSALQPPIPAPLPVATALTSTTAGTAAVSVVAATTTDTQAAVAQPVPLGNHSVPNSGASLPSTPTTITIAPNHNVLQPSLVMSDQNLQWILSSAANSQQNPEQAVSNALTHYFLYIVPIFKSTFLHERLFSLLASICHCLCFNVCSQQQGAPKVENVFFTTAIPVGGNAGKFMSIESKCFLFLVQRS